MGVSLLLAGGMGGLSLLNTISAQKDKDAQALSDAKSLGIQHAGITFGAERRGEFIVGKLKTIQESRQRSFIEIDKAHARAESDAKVAAAAAGVDGHSVEAVINDTERSQTEAKNSINKQVRAQALQLSTDYVDNFLNAEISKGTTEFKTKSTGTRFGEAALSFGSGFVGSGFFGE